MYDEHNVDGLEVVETYTGPRFGVVLRYRPETDEHITHEFRRDRPDGTYAGDYFRSNVSGAAANFAKRVAVVRGRG